MSNLREILDQELAKIPEAPPAFVRVKSGRVVLEGSATTAQYSLLNVVLHNARKRLGKPFEVRHRLAHIQDQEDDTKLIADAPEHTALLANFVGELIREARAEDKDVVAFTGAGISTAAKIPDFRGPNGVWTRRDRGLPRPESVRLEAAVPTYTHRSLVDLHTAKLLTFVVSQNVDGLHLRSGLPRGALAELHGNCFLEACAVCHKEYLRLYDVKRNHGPFFAGEVDEASTSSISHITGRKCDDCGGRLRDTIIHFHENLPEKDLDLANKTCTRAGLVLCLGSSMKVTPACDQPFEGSAVVVIVSRQPTGKDTEALASGGVVVHQNCDDFMAHIMTQLNVGTANTPEAAAAYAELFMEQTRKQLTTAAQPSSGSEESAAPAARTQQHFFSTMGLPTTMTQLPHHLLVKFENLTVAPSASTIPPSSIAAESPSRQRTATVEAPDAYPVRLHELLARVELRADGNVIAAATTAPFVVREPVDASAAPRAAATLECAVFFNPGLGAASKAPLVAKLSPDATTELPVPPMTLPPAFADRLRTPGLRHVITRVTRADGTSYEEDAHKQ